MQRSPPLHAHEDSVMSMSETGIQLRPDPLNLLNYTKASLVERIMTLAGRASNDPVRYRRMLEDCSIETLQQKRDEIQRLIFSPALPEEETLLKGLGS